ncbi:hypothetical protein [Prevotella fusca]
MQKIISTPRLQKNGDGYQFVGKGGLYIRKRLLLADIKAMLHDF